MPYQGTAQHMPSMPAAHHRAPPSTARHVTHPVSRRDVVDALVPRLDDEGEVEVEGEEVGVDDAAGGVGVEAHAVGPDLCAAVGWGSWVGWAVGCEGGGGGGADPWKGENAALARASHMLTPPQPRHIHARTQRQVGKAHHGQGGGGEGLTGGSGTSGHVVFEKKYRGRYEPA